MANDAQAVGDSGECVVSSACTAAALAGQLLQVGQLALVHPPLHQARLQAVEPEDDELLVDGGGRTSSPAAKGGAEARGKQDHQVSFHGCRQVGKL